jgi:hypothetical protein
MSEMDYLKHLSKSLELFAMETNERLSRIETTMARVAEFVGAQPSTMTTTTTQTRQATQQQPQQPPPSSHVASSNNNNNLPLHVSFVTTTTTQMDLNQFELQVTQLPKKWYAKRAFPDFEMFIANKNTGQIFEGTKDWELNVRLISGHGLYVDHFLGQPNIHFPIRNGKIHIFGLKIGAVSSRNGGHFKFECTVQTPEAITCIGKLQFASSEFQILSERLITDRKVDSILQLSASDNLSRVPGIGKKYTSKLREQGIYTVHDLSTLDSSPSARDVRVNLLAMIRKDRGALTEQKFSELIRDAKTVAEREVQQIVVKNEDSDEIEEHDLLLSNSMLEEGGGYPSIPQSPILKRKFDQLFQFEVEENHSCSSSSSSPGLKRQRTQLTEDDFLASIAAEKEVELLPAFNDVEFCDEVDAMINTTGLCDDDDDCSI